MLNLHIDFPLDSIATPAPGIGHLCGDGDRLPSASLLPGMGDCGASAIAMGLGQTHWVGVRAVQPWVTG